MINVKRGGNDICNDILQLIHFARHIPFIITFIHIIYFHSMNDIGLGLKQVYQINFSFLKLY